MAVTRVVLGAELGGAELGGAELGGAEFAAAPAARWSIKFNPTVIIAQSSGNHKPDTGTRACPQGVGRPTSTCTCAPGRSRPTGLATFFFMMARYVGRAYLVGARLVNAVSGATQQHEAALAHILLRRVQPGHEPAVGVKAFELHALVLFSSKAITRTNS